jgi:hypothetical protein
MKCIQYARKPSPWTRPPRFRDRDAPGSNPGPPTKSEYDHQRYGPRSQGGGSQPDHNFLERHLDARPEAILKFDWKRVGELPHKFTITAICVEGKEL